MRHCNGILEVFWIGRLDVAVTVHANGFIGGGIKGRVTDEAGDLTGMNLSLHRSIGIFAGFMVRGRKNSRATNGTVPLEAPVIITILPLRRSALMDPTPCGNLDTKEIVANYKRSTINLYLVPVNERGKKTV